MKKWKGQRLLSIVVALLMIFSLVPTGVLPTHKAHAAQVQTFFNFQSISNTYTNAVQVNQSSWTVTAGFDNSIIGNSINYTVQPAYLSSDGSQVYTIQGQMNKGNGPTIDSNNLVASFANVPLFSGLNAVTFYGQRNDGSSVQNTGYIYNASVPVISSISIGGQPLTGNTPTIVTNPNFSFSVVAPNATTLQVYQSGNPVPYSGMPTVTNTFSVSNFNFNDVNGNPVGGQYNFTFVASDATHQYSVTRSVIFYPSPMPTFYGMQAAFGSQGPFSIDYNPTISVDATTNPLKTITGHIVLDDNTYLPSGTNNNTVTVDVYDSKGNSKASQSIALSTDPSVSVVNNGSYSDFNFSTNFNQQLPNDTYQVKLFLNGSTLVHTDTFTIRNPNGVYFSSVTELTNVTGLIAGGSGNSNGDQITLPGNNLSVAQVPNYLEANMTNSQNIVLPQDSGYFTISTLQNGSTTTLRQGTDYDLYKMQDGNVGIKFYDLPAGNYVLTISYDDTSAPAPNNTDKDSVSLNVTNQVAPNIQLFNVYDTEAVTTATQDVYGQLVNFPNVSGTPVNITLNGTSMGSVTADSQGKFNFSVSLQSGQNILLLTSYVNNSPVQLRYTLNYASSTKPVISVSGFQAWDQNKNPVPITQSGSNINAYATNGSKAAFTISYSYASNISVSVGGKVIPLPLPNVQTSSTSTITLDPQILVSGTTTFTITASDNNGNIVTLTVLITRNQTPFSVVFPTDFQTSQTYVTNANFIDLVIQTSTADDVTIGKLETTPFNTDPVYGTTEYGIEIQNLKPGVNTIPIQITRGTNKIKGSVSVNYLNQNRTGAEYKGQLPSSGTMNALNGIVQLQFAKNTVFQPQNPNPGQPPVSQVYYSNQQVLFGIADRNTGNVSKVSMQLNTPVFPSLTYSATDSRIPLDVDENYASSVIWVDSGDPSYQSQQSAVSNNFIPVGGLDPAGVMNPIDILSGNVSGYQNNNYLSRIGAFGQSSYSHWLDSTNGGNITLQYDPTIRNAATNSLTILYLDHQTGRWTKIGGVVNTSKHTITGQFQGFGYYVVASYGNRYLDVAGLTDVNGMWAKPYVETMLSKGIMNPETSTSFGVYDPITRGEFVEILVKALGIPLNYDSNKLTFADVGTYKAPGQMWDYQYIETAARAGIVAGIGGGVFNPNSPIERQDATVIIARAANLPMAIDPSASLVALKKAFIDAGSVYPYAAPSVLAVYQKGIMSGNPNPVSGPKAKPTYSFNPNGNMLRAEAAVIATRLMQQLKLLPTKL